MSQPMKRRDFIKLSGATVLGSSALLSACGSTANTGSGTPVTIKFWNGGYAVSDPNDKTKKPDQFYINQAIKRFQSQNPGVTINMERITGDSTQFTKYRVASIAKNGPDVMTTWSGSYMLALKQFIHPLDSYFTPEERSRIKGWDAVTDGFKAGAGTTYGVPNGSDGISVVYYNKSLISKAGLDFETGFPKNFDEFLTIAGKIKASGSTPFVFSSNGYTFFSLDYWIAQAVNGSPGIGELVSGKRNFSDPEVVEVFQKWVQLAPYTVTGTTTMTDDQSNQLFSQGKAAMTINGPWPISDMHKVLGDNLAMHKLPNFNDAVTIRDTGIGGAGTALIVSSYTKHPDEAVKFIKFLLSKDEQEQQAKTNLGGLINVSDVDVSKIYTEPLRLQEQQWALEPNAMFWPDNVYPAELTSELGAQAQLAWTGKISPQELGKRLDAKRNALLQGNNS